MSLLADRMIAFWRTAGHRFLPFADAATPDLPMGRLLRLSLFQVTIGMATALCIGTLNRVMIVELGVSASLVSLMIALPILVAPFRALIGHRSDTHASALGWRRVPFIWFGTLALYGGLAIMPFSLIVLSGDGGAPVWLGQAAAAVAFLMIGAGIQVTQTAGLALATDLAPREARPRVVALMYVMLLLGMIASGAAFGLFLSPGFTPIRLIQVIQSAAVVALVLNCIALWKQERRDAGLARRVRDETPDFRTSWRMLTARPGTRRFLVAVALGTLAFNMQDIVLEPFGGEILNMPVGATSWLTALLAGGTLCAFALAARLLANGFGPYRLAGLGAAVGLPAFACVLLAIPLDAPSLFRVGAVLIGLGGGLFAVGTLTAAMDLDGGARNGLALGAWGAVQATAAGVALAAGGLLRDLFVLLGDLGLLSAVLRAPAAPYAFVYLIELVLLFAAIAVLGPLAGRDLAIARTAPVKTTPLGLAGLPN